MAGEVQPITVKQAVAVTKSDVIIYKPVFDALWIGGAGDVAIRDLKGGTTTLAGVAAGSVIPCSCDMVMSTNTTATSIVGLRYG